MWRNTSCARLVRRQHSAASRWRQFASSAADSSKPRTALFFPGAGSHKIGMTKAWQEAFPRTVKPFLEEVDEILKISLTKIIEGGLNETLQRTSNAQPAIFATSIMVLKVLEEDFDFRTSERIDFTLGHSLGEYAALVAGGYMSFQDALRIVRRRGEVFEEAARQARQKYGDDLGMVALVCESHHFGELLDDIRQFLGTKGTGHSMKDPAPDRKPPIEHVVIANVNSNNQVVLSGSLPQIKKLLGRLREFGGHDPRAVTLRTECPFHSPMMKPAADVVQKYFVQRKEDNDDVFTFPGMIPCISNVTAKPFKSKGQLEDLVARGAVETLRWWESIRYLDQDMKVRRWLGLGPGKVGRNLIGKSIGHDFNGVAAKTGGVWSLTDPKEIDTILEELDKTESVVPEE